MNARASIVIVGGGISGLSAAWEVSDLCAARDVDARIEVIESSSAVGGALTSREFAGRIVDCGPDGFLARRPEATTLVDELGWHDHLEPIAASGAWIFLQGHLRALPDGLALGVPTSAKSLKSLKGLSRSARRAAWRDQYVPRRLAIGDDASIGDIIRTKLGDEIALQLVEPMIGGIQAGRIDDLSALSVFPALLTAARRGGSLMKAMGAVGPVRPGPASAAVAGPAFYSLTSSIGSLAPELVRQLRDRGVIVTTGTAVSALRRTPAVTYPWEVDTATTTTPASALIVATPPQSAGSLLGKFDPALASLKDVPSASNAMVTFCVPEDKVVLPSTGTGVLVPLGSPSPFGDSLMVTAITLLDRKWPHLRRNGEVLLRAHVGRSDDERHLTLSDDALSERVLAELTFILSFFPAPLATMVIRWPSGLPQYRVGHATVVTRARDAASRLGVALAGNAYDGVGIPASIGSGRRAALEAVTALENVHK